MDTTESKVQETAPLPIPCKVEEINAAQNSKDACPVKISIENGSAGDKNKKSAESVNLPDDQQNSSAVSKPSETAGAKQTNNKSGETGSKKTSREEKYSRRKDERSVEQVMRTLNGFESPQDKLDALVKKYAEVIDENRKLQLQTKNFERRLGQVEREKDTAQSEHSKAVLTRSRLEGLCRELQRQNKAIKEESLLRIREEEEKRKEVSNKFQSTLAEITSLMQQNNEKNSKLRDDNIEMTTKFKSVCEQYELRVQQVEKISKQMQLEAQLADAKLAKANLEAKAEKETLLRDKTELLMELAQCQARAREQQQTEIELRSQVELYTNKYDEFQTALARSNEVFGGFKEEMDRMSKKIVKLEKETSTWKLRWEKSHQALLEMAADKQQRDAELALANRQLAQLHKLCRTLTEERAKLMAQINANSNSADTTKEEKLAVEIAEDRRKLNDTLDSLQSVILERELLQKQQQLEKQQQQLQVELQKRMSTAVAPPESSSKSNDNKASDAKSAEVKTNDCKAGDVKAMAGKNCEVNRKKAKKQKSGRQGGGKLDVAEGSKVEEDLVVNTSVTVEDKNANENAPSSDGNTVPEVLPAVEEKNVEASGSPDPVSGNIPEVSVLTVENKLENDLKPTLDLPEPLKTDSVLEADNSQVSLISETLNQSVAAVSEVAASPPAIVAFSYAAAVGSKPAEPAVTDKCQKTEEKLTDPKLPSVIPESENVTSNAPEETSLSTQASEIETSSMVSEKPNTKTEDAGNSAPPVVSPKKGKEGSNKKKKHK